jgi:hypothetical protein
MIYEEQYIMLKQFVETSLDIHKVNTAHVIVIRIGTRSCFTEFHPRLFLLD